MEFEILALPWGTSSNAPQKYFLDLKTQLQLLMPLIQYLPLQRIEFDIKYLFSSEGRFGFPNHCMGMPMRLELSKLSFSKFLLSKESPFSGVPKLKYYLG